MKVFDPSEKTLMAMINLSDNDDFQEIVLYLTANEIYLAKLACQMPDELNSRRCQGGSGTLTSLLKQVNEAGETLVKLRAKEAKKKK